MRFLLTIILLMLLSCSEEYETETENYESEVKKYEGEINTLDFGEFRIEVPATWQQRKLNGVDSYVGQIILDNADTVSFDLGRYSNSLDEEYKFKIENGNVYLKNEKRSTPSLPVYDFYGKADTTDIERLKVNKINWTIIDGKRAKIIQPRQSGRGMTGIYFDSLWKASLGIDKFQMNGSNLHPDNEKRLLRAFETLKFKK